MANHGPREFEGIDLIDSTGLHQALGTVTKAARPRSITQTSLSVKRRMFARPRLLTPACPTQFPLGPKATDATTLDEIVDAVRERQDAHGCVWVFDRGILSEENLKRLRKRGDLYLVGTPRHCLDAIERELLGGKWEPLGNHPGVKVKLIRDGGEVFVVARRDG